MKRNIILFTVISLYHIAVFGQKKYEMVVEKNDGTEVVIKTEEIVRTYFREISGEDNPVIPVQTLTAVDLGLPSGTKWANQNLGITEVKPFGGYYSWGEVCEKQTYYRRDYQYGSSETNLINIGNDIAGTEYDVAHKLLGGSWRMPSSDDTNELINNCYYQWTIQNGQKGGLFTSKINGNSIFLPAGGVWWDGTLHECGKSGNYWTSTLDSSRQSRALVLYFSESEVGGVDPAPRYDGNNIRPVCR